MIRAYINATTKAVTRAVIPGSGLNLPTQFYPNIINQYYWWDNDAYGLTRRIKIIHEWDGGVYGTNYTIDVASDAHYEITDISIGTLVNKATTESSTNQLTANYGINQRIDRFTFTGTSVKLRLNKGASFGILKAILLDGTFRGDISGTSGVVADAKTGYYYFIYANGNYSAIDAAFTALVKGDIIQYDGSAWHLFHENEYTYIDVDCYNSSGIVVNQLLFDNLPYGTYNVGIKATGSKNESSTGVNVFPTVATKILSRAVSAYGGIPNAIESTTVINGGANTLHWEMSTRIEKNGAGQTSGWIPEHSNSGTQLNYHSGEDMQNWADGVEITGFNIGDQEAVECNNFTLQNISYAVHAAAPLEELMKVTTDIVFTITGVNIKNKYEALIDTYTETNYSYMLPYDITVFNKFVSDYKEELSIPETGAKANVTEGPKRKTVFVYNNTPGGDNENVILLISVNNTTVTNLNSALQSFLSTFGTTWGKFYCLASNGRLFSVGESWQTDVVVKCGYIPDLITKVSQYIG